eukprot:352675-Chlamydomonas_euryale.AAC.1
MPREEGESLATAAGTGAPVGTHAEWPHLLQRRHHVGKEAGDKPLLLDIPGCEDTTGCCSLQGVRRQQERLRRVLGWARAPHRRRQRVSRRRQDNLADQLSGIAHRERDTPCRRVLQQRQQAEAAFMRPAAT